MNSGVKILALASTTPRASRTTGALAYQRETCDLLLAGAGEEIFRLNLERGSFLNPLRTGASGINVLGVHPTHGMLAAGTSDGLVQCWDPRQRAPLGSASPFDHPQVIARPSHSAALPTATRAATPQPRARTARHE